MPRVLPPELMPQGGAEGQNLGHCKNVFLFTSKFLVKVSLSEYISLTTQQKAFLFKPWVPERVSFYVMSFGSRVHGGGRVVRWCWVNFQCRGVLLIWARVGQGPIALAIGAGGCCLDIFSLVYPFSLLSPSLWETARYRLKYCLKGPLSPKQPTNIQDSCPEVGLKVKI